jgi:hypothetical protein
MKFAYVLFGSLALCCSAATALDLGNLIDKQRLESIGKPAAEVQPGAAAASQTAQDSASALSGFSSKDQVGALKQALSQGAETAVASLGRQDGFLGNDKVRIPLPKELQRAADVMHKFGLGKYPDELVTSMNRAAEAAVPEARTLLVGAVKSMSVEDAKGILTGGSDSATQYFRKKTEATLAARFKPIVSQSMQKVKLAEKYNEFASKGAELGLVDHENANLDDYVTRKAMDGLFLMIGEQEKAIRENPLQATGALAQKIFSAIKF